MTIVPLMAVELPLHAHIARMRAAGMSEEAIRRAIGELRSDASVSHSEGPCIEISGSAGVTHREIGDAHQRASEADTGAIEEVPAEPWKRHLPRMQKILEVVADETGVARFALRCPIRARRYSRPRQLLMLVLRDLCPEASLPCIGYFLRRDHATVVHGIRRAAHRVGTDGKAREIYRRIVLRIAGPDG